MKSNQNSKIFPFLIVLFAIISAAAVYTGFEFFWSAGEKFEGEKYMSEKIILKTKDGVEIAGDFYKTEKKDAPAAVLLHMMPADKSSYKELAEKLAASGFQSLAIDLRGHGESTKKGGKIIDFRKFSDEEHQESILDVEAAAEFFKNRGVPAEKIYFVGASIGANLSLRHLSEHSDFKKAVLLSPGLNYRGIETEPSAEKLSPAQAVYFIAAKGDAYSDESDKQLYAITKAEKKIKTCDGSAHGTDLFKTNPELLDKIVEFLKR